MSVDVYVGMVSIVIVGGKLEIERCVSNVWWCGIFCGNDLV